MKRESLVLSFIDNNQITNELNTFGHSDSRRHCCDENCYKKYCVDYIHYIQLHEVSIGLHDEVKLVVGDVGSYCH